MRKRSFKFHFDVRNSEVSVFKTLFTFKKISNGILSRALNAKISGTDGRGKISGSSRKTEEEKT